MAKKRKTGALNPIFVLSLFGAIVLFEAFDFLTSQFALNAFLGGMSLNLFGFTAQAGTLLALALRFSDAPALGRVLTPEQGMRNEPREVLVGMGGWFLVALFNAGLTYWAVEVGLRSNQTLMPSLLADPTTVAIYAAVLVLVARILIIGSFAFVADRYVDDIRKARETGHKPARSQTRTRTTRRPKSTRKKNGKKNNALDKFLKNPKKDQLPSLSNLPTPMRPTSVYLDEE